MSKNKNFNNQQKIINSSKISSKIQVGLVKNVVNNSIDKDTLMKIKDRNELLDPQIFKDNPFQTIKKSELYAERKRIINKKQSIISNQFENFNNRFDFVFTHNQGLIQRQIINFMQDSKLIYQRESELVRRRSHQTTNAFIIDDINTFFKEGYQSKVKKTFNFNYRLKQNQDFLNIGRKNIKRRSSHDQGQRSELTTRYESNQEFEQVPLDSYNSNEYKIISNILSFFNLNIQDIGVEYDPSDDTLVIISNKKIKFNRVRPLKIDHNFNSSFWFNDQSVQEQFNGQWRSNDKIDGVIDLKLNENDGFTGLCSINAKFTDKRSFGYIKINIKQGTVGNNNNQDQFNILNFKKSDVFESLQSYLSMIYFSYTYKTDFDVENINIQHYVQQKKIIIQYNDEIKFELHKRGKDNTDVNGNYSQNDEFKIEIFEEEDESNQMKSNQFLKLKVNSIKIKLKQNQLPINYRNHFFKPDKSLIPFQCLKSSQCLDIVNSNGNLVKSQNRNNIEKMQKNENYYEPSSYSRNENLKSLNSMQLSSIKSNIMQKIVNTKSAKYKVINIAKAQRVIKRLNLMRIKSAFQFGNELNSNKEYQMKWQSLYRTFKDVNLIYESIIQKVIEENTQKSWFKKNKQQIAICEFRFKRETNKERDQIQNQFIENSKFLDQKRNLIEFKKKFQTQLYNNQFQDHYKYFIEKDQELRDSINNNNIKKDDLSLPIQIDTMSKNQWNQNNYKKIYQAAYKPDLKQIKPKQSSFIINEKDTTIRKFSNNIDILSPDYKGSLIQSSNTGKIKIDNDIQINNTFNVNRQVKNLNLSNKIEIKRDDIHNTNKNVLNEKKVKFSKQNDIIEYNSNQDAESNTSEKIRNKNDYFDQKIFRNEQDNKQKKQYYQFLKTKDTQSNLFMNRGKWNFYSNISETNKNLANKNLANKNLTNDKQSNIKIRSVSEESIQMNNQNNFIKSQYNESFLNKDQSINKINNLNEMKLPSISYTQSNSSQISTNNNKFNNTNYDNLFSKNEIIKVDLNNEGFKQRSSFLLNDIRFRDDIPSESIADDEQFNKKLQTDSINFNKFKSKKIIDDKKNIVNELQNNQPSKQIVSKSRSTDYLKEHLNQNKLKEIKEIKKIQNNNSKSIYFNKIFEINRDYY